VSEGLVAELATNMGMSVERIDRFCAGNMPLSKEMAKSLQSFGSE